MVTQSHPSVLLLGGGYTLHRVAEMLPKSSVLLTTRSPEKIEQFLSEGFLATRLDVLDPAMIATVFATYPSLRIIVDGIPPLRDDEPARGVREIARSAYSCGTISRFVYLSTTGVYGSRDGRWVDEDSPCEPWHRQGKARLECENIYRGLKIQSSILRVPAIYGPGRGMDISLKQGTYRIIGDGERWTNRVHVEDLAASIVAIVQTSNSQVPPTLCVSDDEPVKQSLVVEEYCRRLNIKAPPSTSVEEAEAREQFTMLSNQRVSNRRLREFLGAPLKFPTYRTWLEQLEGAQR